MHLPPTRALLAFAFLMTLCACAPVKPLIPDELPRPLAPASELMEACRPITGDDGTVVGALHADTMNRDALIECQIKHSALAATIMRWIEGGLLRTE